LHQALHGVDREAESEKGRMNPPLNVEAVEVTPDLEQVQAQLEEIVAASRRVQIAQENLSRAKALADDHMKDFKVRFLLLRLQEAAGVNEGLAEQWAALLQDCPEDLQVVRFCAMRLVKDRRVEEAMALVDHHLPESDDAARMFARAKLLSDIRAHDRSDEL